MAVWQPRSYLGWVAFCGCQKYLMPFNLFGWLVYPFVKRLQLIYKKIMEALLSIQLHQLNGMW